MLTSTGIKEAHFKAQHLQSVSKNMKQLGLSHTTTGHKSCKCFGERVYQSFPKILTNQWPHSLIFLQQKCMDAHQKHVLEVHSGILCIFPNWKLPECAAAERRNILYDHSTQCDKGMDMNNQLLHATAQELLLMQYWEKDVRPKTVYSMTL